MPKPRPAKTRVVRAMERFPCSRCGAQPGEECRTRTGSRAGYPHSARFDAATQAGELPLLDGG
jgi:hypothetical protein